MGSIEPAVRTKSIQCEAIYEIIHTLNCGFVNQVSYDHRSFERNSSNCVEKPEKVGTST